MKLMRWFFVVILAASAHQALGQVVNFHLPETDTEVALTFRQSTKANGDFRSLTILSNGTRTSFISRNPLLRVPYNSQFLLERGIQTNISGLRLHPSRFFLTGTFKAGSRPHTLLLFIGEAGIGAAPVFVIGFSDDGQPFKVLERDELDVTSIQASQDGELIIGKTSLSQVMGGDGGSGSKTPYATTYDPFSVYIVRPSSPAAYSLEESRCYNKEHYVWAGPHVREDYAVLYNMPGHSKPLGAPASRVEGLLAHAGAK